MVTVKLRSIETPDEAFLRVLHDVVVSAFKFGGNRRFFGADTANFVGCRGGTRAIPLLVVSTSLSHTLWVFDTYGWGNLEPGWRTAPKSLNAAAMDNYNNFLKTIKEFTLVLQALLYNPTFTN